MVASFEEPVKRISGKYGYIDLFWPGTLLVEHKGAEKNLDSAFLQATDYVMVIPEHERPRYVIVSDFRRIRLLQAENEAAWMAEV